MENKTETEYIKNIRCPECYTESGTDYVLPDYYGDVRKILYTSAQLHPAGSFAGGDGVEFSGIVVYDVVYLDSENKLTGVSFSSDYSYAVKCTSESYRGAFGDGRVSNYSLRLVGPRKISARASVVGSVRVAEADFVNAEGDAFEREESLELMQSGVMIRKSIAAEPREREYAESLARLDGAIADEVSVLYPFAEAVIDEVSLGEGEITLRGSIVLSAIIKNGATAAYQRERVVPVEETVSCPEAREGVRFIPKASISSLRVEINADEGGCEVVVSLIAEFSALGETNERLEIISDAYLKSCGVDNMYDDFAYTSLSEVIIKREEESSSFPRSEIEAESIREIVFLRAQPKIDYQAVDDGVLKVKGEIKYSGIASENLEDGGVSYLPIRFSAPFEKEFELSVGDGARNPAIIARCYSASATFDTGRIYASCNLELCGAVTSEHTVKRLVSCNAIPEDENENDPSRIVVYYPAPGETLFSVAKKYKKSSIKIANDNSLVLDSSADGNGEIFLNGVEKLLIY